MQKTLIILAAVLSITSIGLGYLNLTKLAAAKRTITATASDRDIATKKAAAMALEIKSTEEKLSNTTMESDKAASQVSDLQARLNKATSDQADLQKQVTQKDADMAQQKTDLAAKDTRIAELESKISGTSQPSSDPTLDLKKQLSEKDILATSLQSKNKEMEAQLSDLRQREAQRKAKVMRTGLEGKILAVNSSWNFVVISLGDRNGVVSNSELLINRGGQLIGKVRITSVEPSTSIADIVVNSVRSGSSVQPGDTVIYTGPESEADAKQ